MITLNTQVTERLRATVALITAKVGAPANDLDTQIALKWRYWLGEDLPWAGSGITDDEFFFLSTLCGTMTVDGQRTHMRRFLPIFANQAGSKIARLSRDMIAPWRLRSPWMKTRLLRKASVLHERQQDMSCYTDNLRRLETTATALNPVPALERIVHDHGGGGRKTLSIFVRDCVLGNSFPIDSRVLSVLQQHGLPSDEMLLVQASLAAGLNPRNVARQFYDAGGQGAFFTGATG